jgi:hypothetical protein
MSIQRLSCVLIEVLRRRLLRLLQDLGFFIDAWRGARPHAGGLFVDGRWCWWTGVLFSLVPSFFVVFSFLPGTWL